MEVLNPFLMIVIIFFLASLSFADDRIFLDCGSSESIPSNGRTWTGDISSHYISNEQQTKAIPINVNPSHQTDGFLFSTVRVSRSEFSYFFPIPPGPKFIRLHFYPASYPEGYDATKTFFSVKTGNFTLLSNFSASLTADAESSSTVMKEFSLYVHDSSKKLDLTFTPSNSSPGSFAFINGVEVVPIPEDLYYTADNDTDGITQIGERNRYRVEKSLGLETIARLNVGGKDIPPEKDAGGMFRWWKPDDSYFMSQFSVLPFNNTIHLNFSKIANYSAPEQVYKTARTMGPYKEINKRENLTWEIQVDSGFTYFLRLHFCEFQSNISANYDRLFEIFVAKQVAELHADVIMWADGAARVPVYRNYAVMMGANGGIGHNKKRNFSIDLQTVADWKTRYNDAILNGIELFKLSNGDSNLAGPNPDSVPKQQPTSPKKRQFLIPVIVSSAALGIVLLLVFGIFKLRRRGQRSLKQMDPSRDGTSRWTHVFITPNSTTSRDSRNSSLPLDLCHQFSLAEITAATKNFDNVFIIGKGGFGNVYKGYINNSDTPVAIKRLNPESQQGFQEFVNEIGMLSQLRHLHLVSLIGYCHEEGEMILVYEYMANGTLRQHLYNTDNPPLSWKQRLEICINAAKGLLYLHTGATHTIIHRDVKTTNILLDEKWVAKVSDFGISRLGPTTVSKAHVSTVVKGTFGYLDPEYYRRQQLSDKSDVYSFGVVLLEVLCGRPPIIRTNDKKAQASLVQWVQQSYSAEMFHHVIDPNLNGEISPKCLEKYMEIALACVKDNGTHRPSMKDIVGSLEFALQFQESTEDRLFQASPDDSGFEAFSTGDERSSTWTGHSQSVMSAGAVFSEIASPKDR